MKKILFPLLLALLAGCASGPYIDKSYSARGQSSRVRFIVLHYTVADNERSLKTLTEQEVSSHYLVTNGGNPTIYRLVDEQQAAWHSGVSSWKEYSRLNDSSIGIEIVNTGFVDGPDGRQWEAFPQSQIDLVIPLVRQIALKHKVKPEYILGHSDVAPQRKTDPGPLFPWEQLAKAGLITWPNPDAVALAKPAFELSLPDMVWFQKKLAQHGYAIAQTGIADEQTKNVMAAFQMKYRPTRFDGQPDAETAAMLEALTAAPLKQ